MTMRIALPGLILTLTLLAGCGSWGFPGVYRINVEQGNIVTQDMLDQLKPGMTRQQVRYILGTPLVEDTFDRERWDYLYTLRNGTNTLQDYRLTVYFEGDEMARYTTDKELPAGNRNKAGDEAEEEDSAEDDSEEEAG